VIAIFAEVVWMKIIFHAMKQLMHLLKTLLAFVTNKYHLLGEMKGDEGRWVRNYHLDVVHWITRVSQMRIANGWWVNWIGKVLFTTCIFLALNLLRRESLTHSIMQRATTSIYMISLTAQLLEVTPVSWELQFDNSQNVKVLSLFVNSFWHSV
jgi:hypothetical protein